MTTTAVTSPEGEDDMNFMTKIRPEQSSKATIDGTEYRRDGNLTYKISTS